MKDTPRKSLKPIVLKTPVGFIYFDYDEIVMLKAEGNCTLVYTMENDSPVRVLHNLSYICENYCNKMLYRCHKSYIINLRHIEKLMIKSRQVQMKNNLIARLSAKCLRELRNMSEIKIRKT
jgi:DNA-binding LytR/AlgR family response regulator